jgi:hypothetical protein
LGAQRVALGLGLGELCARLLEGVLKRVVLVQQLVNAADKVSNELGVCHGLGIVERANGG